MEMVGNLTELLTVVGSIVGSYIFIYSEIKNFRTEFKADNQDIRNTRKTELEQAKQEVIMSLNDVKQTFKSDLNTFKIDLTTHRKELKDELVLMKEDHRKEIISLREEAKKDMKEMQKEIIALTEKIAMLNGMLGFLRDNLEKK